MLKGLPLQFILQDYDMGMLEGKSEDLIRFAWKSIVSVALTSHPISAPLRGKGAKIR